MSEDLQNYLNEIRRDFSGKPLNEDSVQSEPIDQFNVWFEEAVDAQLLDPYAMSIATVDEKGQPSLRVVYMRGISEEGLVFYTNYKSQKGVDMNNNPRVSLNFFWGSLERQVRIEGIVEKVSAIVSDDYFKSRPRESQIGAWASAQSSKLSGREELESKIKDLEKEFEGKEVTRPPHWGGYLVRPHKIEFWQGRPNRLHDRILYSRVGERWEISRLSP